MHIPFFTGSVPVPLTEQIQQERAMKEARHAASASIGNIIALGEDISREDTMHFFEQKVLPFVQSKLPGVHYRVQKCYSLVLTVAKLVSIYDTI